MAPQAAGRLGSPARAPLREAAPAAGRAARRSPVPRAGPPPAPWAQERLLRLDAGPPARVKLLDEAIGSVVRAVKLLNLGVVYCPEDVCAVHDEQDRCYYLLYRQGCKSTAFDAAEEVTTASGSSTPRCSTPSCRRLRLERSETPPKLRGPAAAAAPGAALASPCTAPARRRSSPRPPPPPAPAPAPPGGEEAAPVSRCGPEDEDEGEGGPCEELEATSDADAASGGGEADAAEVVDVGGRHFCLQSVIGRGAFGVVWRARERCRAGSDGPVAIKVMSASSEEGLGAALFEAEVLRRLGLQMPSDTCGRVPRYVAHSARRSGTGGAVHLVMSFLPGQVLDQWLYGISDEAHKHVDVEKIVHGGLPGSRQRSMTLGAACGVARELVHQLAGVFLALQPLALHRDVSSHNVLLDFAGAGAGAGPGAPAAPNFALIDFGLAVSAASWPREWNASNLAGDPRYWTPAAWIALALGFRHVEAHPNRGFQRQYLGRIDHYSLGILGLELLFALWDPCACGAEEVVPGLRHARAAWCALWELKFRLFQMFHLQGAQQTQRHLELSPRRPLVRFGELLAGVCRALRAAAQPDATQAALLRVLADLVDEHGVLGWAEVRTALAPSRAPRAEAPAERPRPPVAAPAAVGAAGARQLRRLSARPGRAA